MSDTPRIRSMNMVEYKAKPVLESGGSKARSSFDTPKPLTKPLIKKSVVELEDKNGVLSPTILDKSSPPFNSVRVPSMLESSLHSKLSVNASCSSDASTDFSPSCVLTGRMRGRSNVSIRKKKLPSKARTLIPNGIPEPLLDGLQAKRRCAWITASTDPYYVTFHDEEWGVPAHDDKKLFEYLVLSGALAELTWPSILSKRHIFREVFADFDPIIVAKLDEKKILAPGSPSSSLLSELKLRAIVENARQVSKIIGEFGSFDKYIWSFVNYKPMVGSFRYPRQVPVKTPKADTISKDLIRRGFRGVGPTVIYSFLQVAGLTNDHLISCFRFHGSANAEVKVGSEFKDEAHAMKANSGIGPEMCRWIDALSFSSE